MKNLVAIDVGLVLPPQQMCTEVLVSRLRNESPQAPTQNLSQFAPFLTHDLLEFDSKKSESPKFEETQISSLLKFELPLISRDSKKLSLFCESPHLESP